MREIRRTLVAMLAAALLVSCGAWDEKEVSGEAREDIVGAATVVHEIESGTNGTTSLQVIYLVLDLGAEDAAAAADDQAECLVDAGWTMSSTRVPPARHGGRSTQVNATASVYTLAEYLDDDQYDEEIDAELREAVPDPAGLILVAVEPRT